jgi:uncharacterized protein YcaQ
VAAFRLARHHLILPAGRDPVAVCRDVCGIQAQLMPAAKLSIAARTSGLTPAAIETALWDTRKLVKALSMRQTVHLLPASEFSLYLAAIRRSRVAAVVRIMSRFGITARDTEALDRVTLELLEDGPLPLRELTSRIRPRVPKRVQAWMDRVWNAARLALVEGLICYGPDRGQQVTFVRVDQWLPDQKQFAEGEAQRLLLRRFLKAYGPATLGDFSKWSGIPVGEARNAWEQVQDDLAEVSVNGEPARLIRGDLTELAGAPLPETLVNLLPAFDTFLLAHADKNHLVEQRYYKRVYRSLGQISPVLLVDGRVAGTWRHTQSRAERLTISVAHFGKLTRAVLAGIEEQAARHGVFLGRRVELEFVRG